MGTVKVLSLPRHEALQMVSQCIRDCYEACFQIHAHFMET